LHSIDLHGEVQVIASCQSGGAAAPNLLPPLHTIVDFD
jgi:hypothetical protein